jgi:hypothetical protein
MTEASAMEPITRFSLETHTGPYDQWPRRTMLFDDGRDTRRTIPGYVIDGQYRCPHGILLVLSYDCPFEESYTFLLLGDDLSRRARADLGVPYGSFLLHDHWVVNDSTLRLHFYTTLIYTLAIRPRTAWWQPVYRLQLSREPATAGDARAQASIATLEARLAAMERRS